MLESPFIVVIRFRARGSFVFLGAFADTGGGLEAAVSRHPCCLTGQDMMLL